MRLRTSSPFSGTLVLSMSDIENLPELPNDSLSKAIGRLCVAFSIAEIHLDMLNMILWRDFGGRGQAKEFPQNMKRKLRFFLDCVKSHPRLSPHVDEARDIVEEFKEANDIRVWAVHGAAIEALTTEKKALEFTKAIYGPSPALEQKTISEDDIMLAALRAFAIQVTLDQFVYVRIDGGSLEEFEERFRKSFRKYARSLPHTE